LSKEIIDRVGRVENVGVDFIPEEQRKSKPLNIWWILFGGSMTFSIIIIGWFPVSFGLGWWDSFWAIVVGSVIGSSLLAPMSFFGPRTGTNNPVASGAHFGARGRLIGSVLGVVACIVFAALSVWTAGDVLAESASQIFTNNESGLTLKLVAYGLVAVIMTLIAVMGHANMVALSKFMVPTAGLMMLVGIFVFLPNFDPNYAGGDYLFGSYWPTWTAGMLVVAATTASYGPYVGDWARHISSTKYSQRTMFTVTWLGGFFGMGSAYMFAAYTSVTFANPLNPYATEIVANSPFWYLFPLLFIGIVAGTAQAVINIYSMGLDFSAIFSRLSRIQATILLSGVSTLIVYLGAINSTIINLINITLLYLVVLGTPWVIVNIIGYINRRGHYYPDDLQVFNRRQIGGKYWFTNGLNRQATFAWFLGALAGFLFTNTPVYLAPGAKWLWEVDFGLFISAFVSAIAYIVLLYLFPEPKDAFGPRGARIKSSENYVNTPIQQK
jgi:purine-cytosine permease-like protein